MADAPLLSVNRLSVRYAGTTAVDDLSFSLDAGASLGLVGESGSGKTQTALAILGLLPAAARVSGSFCFAGTQVPFDDEPAIRPLRARQISMVFQDPLQSLNPYVRVGEQMLRILLEHRLCSRDEGRERVLEMLTKVGLPDAQRQSRAFPHQLSGGMRQRAMIAAALITKPRLLIADEPTTALDVTVQAQILDLLETVRDDTALLLITHDLGIIASSCERTLVLDHGEAIEEGTTRGVFSAPAHPRTAALLAAAPRLGAQQSPAALDGSEILEARDIDLVYHEDRLHAVRSTSLALMRGETLALVGESGSGKSSLARALLGLTPPTAGTVLLDGAELAASVAQRRPSTRRRLGMVFQDPVGSLNPQMRVADIIAEPLRVAGQRPATATLTESLQRVDLGEEFLRRFPHQLSGGQAQRVAIARALITGPDVLVCDEAVAALGGRVRQQILALLQSLQRERELAMLFISHDLAIVEGISHRVAVMYLGRLVEVRSARELFRSPQHPYTRALLDAVPEPDPLRGKLLVSAAGDAPSPVSPPTGCAFHPRCQYAVARCRIEEPQLLAAAKSTGNVACHRADELKLELARPL